MKFCDTCRNMMLVVSSEGGRVAHYECPSCSTQEKIPSTTHVLRARTPQDDSSLYSRFINPDLAKDPALPRAPRNVACPFCSKTGGILFVKYHSSDMKFLYHCSQCMTFWKRSNDGIVEVDQQAT